MACFCACLCLRSCVYVFLLRNVCVSLFVNYCAVLYELLLFVCLCVSVRVLLFALFMGFVCFLLCVSGVVLC